ncbi:putative peptide-N(4)-(N-acetyl-beta-glucosaminyl)asparagine amidase [Helianthus annuus]|uniref:Peptide-N(4)-(N-acetyl-beta-glucosaminyl)asparagine amidase n=1 Tax=Helianthus annuus TaxID=4232 RepID=A0A251U663_HELAN|nr:peptide-N4-(N-acetyl-beta-glucosaminyl)asparagine amidase A [Helianthus annuus]KAF5795016.1 putative peptide-N(4)-(N-acetyl-beta-glucosaminyl)asparagine amidase [Helianthus annuus]KAJ0538589.1 putative peptide-N(4)-(N-acetyl-beta-glucosaminyl)asparagine amidase [Helianthus annuus]KAJ0546501.1 putative peptide-N(4)-(N-acetyl-beta-glucosaminyl)asparagine amidase [Helianthus annuus]KAJ0553210.1 putative peptide-N(4)-(N-acetyl-beta-glucosaminyl)asparagine amidase [Helianthus annuus]KAJ0722123.1
MPLQITKAMKITYLFTLIHLFSVQCSPSPSPSPPHFVGKHSLNNTTPQQYFEVTHPLPTDDITPSCSVSLLNHSFANTYGSPPVTVNYTPPKSKCKWSVAVLEFQAECKGEQYDRIAGVWLDGVELLRTSTAQPTEAGIFWKVRKDVSRYSSVISQSNVKLTVMLENIVNKDFTGVYDVNISLHFYSASSVRVPLSIVSGIHTSSSSRKLVSVKNNEIGGKVNVDRVLKALYPYDKPADSVVPISGTNGVNEGFWFKIDDEHDVQTTKVKIASKTYKAVLELYVSFHGNDEFWYMNPSDAYVETNHLSTGRAHGAYREVLVTIDGELVGAVVPFPVIFTGGINPLFWEPVVSIGAFNLPSYDIDLTPFLGRLLDNKDHKIGIQIADGISFWLVDANLHLWVDHSNVKAQTVSSKVPAMEIERKNEFVLLDGEFEIEGERESEVTSWVSSSAGNLTTKYKEKIKFKNKLKFKDQGTKKELDQTYKRKIKIKTTNEMGQVVENLEVKIKYPLDINTETRPGLDRGTTVMTTQVELERSERVSGGTDWMSLSHKLNCTGMMVVKGSSVLSGLAENHQNYNYKDGLGCYTRKVDVVNGVVVGDDPSSICS